MTLSLVIYVRRDDIKEVTFSFNKFWKKKWRAALIVEFQNWFWSIGGRIAFGKNCSFSIAPPSSHYEYGWGDCYSFVARGFMGKDLNIVYKLSVDFVAR